MEKALKLKNYSYPLRGVRASLSPWSSDSDTFKKEQAWLNRAWVYLTDLGLTSYSNDDERIKVSFRAVALALMYLDFCGAAFGEDNEEPAVIHWARILKLAPEDILRLYGNIEKSGYSVEDLKELFIQKNMIIEVANNAREEVYDALLKSFGDSMDFFDSMVEINDSHGFDYDTIIGRALPWFSDKMCQYQPYFN